MEEINWLYIITAGQGIFLSLVLFLKKRSNSGNRLLALLLFLLSVELWIRFDLYLNGSPSIFTLFVLAESFGFIYGPVIYGYTLVTTSYRKNFTWRDVLHAVPALAVLGFNLFYYLIPDYFFVPDNEKVILKNLHLTGEFDVYDYIISFSIMLSMLLYLFLSIRLLKRYSRDSAEFFSDLSKRKFVWLRAVLIMCTLCIVSDLLQTFGYLYHSSIIFRTSDIILYFIMCIILYSAGYFALTQPEIFALPDYISGDSSIQDLNDEKKNIDSAKNEKYIRTKLPEDVADELSNEIRDAMELEKLYIEPDLNLDDFAKRLNTPPHHVSQVINTRFNQNFFMFVNSYRIAEAERLLSDKNGDNKTILEIALESGFNSKTTFNLIFKKTTGMTPSVFRKNSRIL